VTQLALDGIDWSDIGLEDDEDEWNDLDPDPEHRLRDLHGQGLTAVQLHTITDVPITGEYL
jgi:hypothetical protein